MIYLVCAQKIKVLDPQTKEETFWTGRKKPQEYLGIEFLLWSAEEKQLSTLYLEKEKYREILPKLSKRIGKAWEITKIDEDYKIKEHKKVVPCPDLETEIVEYYAKPT